MTVCFHFSACTIAVGILEQLAIVNEKPIDKTIEEACELLPAGLYRDACMTVVETYGPMVIEL